ncbi:MAG: DUF3164 family protein [Desulfobacterales bacterium]|nr:DUF3164 family protein [Desulfobacterales bacterium]
MQEQSDNYWKDPRGRLVPISMISEIDQQRDQLVRELATAAKNLRESMQAFKIQAMGDVQAFCDLSAEKYKVAYGGQKGNVQLVSFDGAIKVQIAISEHLSFDERLQAAKRLIDECLTDWTGESRDEIKTIVLDAFQVDKEGRINTGRILGLRRLNISDDRWLRAMQAIADSMQVIGSKTYLRIYERDMLGKYQPIALDLAAL